VAYPDTCNATDYRYENKSKASVLLPAPSSFLEQYQDTQNKKLMLDAEPINSVPYK
jgi:hypothetical protein